MFFPFKVTHISCVSYSAHNFTSRIYCDLDQTPVGRFVNEYRSSEIATPLKAEGLKFSFVFNLQKVTISDISGNICISIGISINQHE